MTNETKEEVQEEKAPQEESEQNEITTDETVTEGSEEQVQILKEELAEAKENLLRERADFTNFRKRTIQEKADIQAYATAQVLQELLPAVDSFDQLIATRESEGEEADLSKFLDGVSLIQKQLLDSLGKFGVETFDPTGSEFDPNTMEALSKQESAEVEKETVSQVYQKGYQIAGKTIRAARVAVLSPQQKAESQPEGENEKEENSAGSNQEGEA